MSLPNLTFTIISLPTEIEWRYTEKGERVRVSVRSGRIIPLPGGAQELEDFVNPLQYAGLNEFLCGLLLGN